ncbi:hypothetical protein OsJ_35622 [Oryza sativa Japonica Group]|uniref:Uncharacterized protein n=2 Tax=Oryza sativa subsp. japonica TaxID=39947 RepID=A0A8J8Y465_ORYSJ|nr:hypothetical protein LOC_Os12g12610 [Oryza sativa Japonica Group]EAZ20025.1 hypothetical protein OsJ_35622 [Oryza sativa Japonica Group]
MGAAGGAVAEEQQWRGSRWQQISGGGGYGLVMRKSTGGGVGSARGRPPATAAAEGIVIETGPCIHKEPSSLVVEEFTNSHVVVGSNPTHAIFSLIFPHQHHARAYNHVQAGSKRFYTPV